MEKWFWIPIVPHFILQNWSSRIAPRHILTYFIMSMCTFFNYPAWQNRFIWKPTSFLIQCANIYIHMYVPQTCNENPIKNNFYLMLRKVFLKRTSSPYKNEREIKRWFTLCISQQQYYTRVSGPTENLQMKIGKCIKKKPIRNQEKSGKK